MHVTVFILQIFDKYSTFYKKKMTFGSERKKNGNEEGTYNSWENRVSTIHDGEDYYGLETTNFGYKDYYGSNTVSLR